MFSLPSLHASWEPAGTHPTLRHFLFDPTCTVHNRSDWQHHFSFFSFSSFWPFHSNGGSKSHKWERAIRAIDVCGLGLLIYWSWNFINFATREEPWMNQPNNTQSIFFNCLVKMPNVSRAGGCERNACATTACVWMRCVPLIVSSAFKTGRDTSGLEWSPLYCYPLLFHHLSWQRVWFIGALWPSVRAGTVGYINPGDNPSTWGPLSASKWPSVSLLERNPLPGLNQCHKLPISLMSIDHKMM